MILKFDISFSLSALVSLKEMSVLFWQKQDKMGSMCYMFKSLKGY